MAAVLAVSTNGPLRGGWARALEAAGHKVTAVTPVAVSRTSLARHDLCLFDLGTRRDADPAPLLSLLATRPGILVIAMVAVPEATQGLRLLHAGARGYCNRQLSAPALAAVVTTVLAGEIWAGRQVTDYLMRVSLAQPAEPVQPAADVLDGLTEREREIARMVGDGRSNKVIAVESGISERTVKAHLNAIFRKTGIRNRVQLALVVSGSASRRGRLAQA